MADGPNLYGYCLNDPVGNFDPDGAATVRPALRSGPRTIVRSYNHRGVLTYEEIKEELRRQELLTPAERALEQRRIQRASESYWLETLGRLPKPGETFLTAAPGPKRVETRTTNPIETPSTVQPNGPIGGVWILDPLIRGRDIEATVRIEYQKSGWCVLDRQTKAENFPLVDYQLGNNLVSLKTVDTRGGSWMNDMQVHIRDLATRGATVNGVAANMFLDVRVQPGGAAAAQQLIQYGKGLGVGVIIKEFP